MCVHVSVCVFDWLTGVMQLKSFCERRGRLNIVYCHSVVFPIAQHLLSTVNSQAF